VATTAPDPATDVDELPIVSDLPIDPNGISGTEVDALVSIVASRQG
jgi:hypothetical protein